MNFGTMQLLNYAVKYFFLVLLFAAMVVAEDELLPINGRVLDPNGQAIVQADVSVEDVDRRFKTSTVTSGSGEVQLALPSGSYIGTTKASGFSEVQQRLTVG